MRELCPWAGAVSAWAVGEIKGTNQLVAPGFPSEREVHILGTSTFAQLPTVEVPEDTISISKEPTSLWAPGLAAALLSFSW